jgi:hypothetical protein
MPIHRSAFGKLMREPLLHFVVLAVALFAIQAIFVGDEREVVRVGKATQDFLIKTQEDLLLRQTTAEEKGAAVQNFIDEEILVREAIARGYTNSSRVRTLLVQNMRFLIAGNLDEPSEAELKAYFEANQAEFTSPSSVDMEQVIFDDPADAVTEILDQLNSGADPSKFGKQGLELRRLLPKMDSRRLVRAFGPKAAREILSLDQQDRRWQGPIVSDIGTAHFIRFAASYPPMVPEFDTAKDWIGTKWYAHKSRELLDNELKKLRKNYLIEIETEEPADNG